MEKANEISEILRKLQADDGQNDRLVAMMKDLLLMAEHEQYLAGFCECMKTVRDGGFKGLEDRLDSTVSQEK